MDVNKLAALTFSSEGPRFLAYKMFPRDIILQVHVAASLAFLLPKVIVIGWKKYKQAGAVFSPLISKSFVLEKVSGNLSLQNLTSTVTIQPSQTPFHSRHLDLSKKETTGVTNNTDKGSVLLSVAVSHGS